MPLSWPPQLQPLWSPKLASGGQSSSAQEGPAPAPPPPAPVHVPLRGAGQVWAAAARLVQGKEGAGKKSRSHLACATMRRSHGRQGFGEWGGFPRPALLRSAHRGLILVEDKALPQLRGLDRNPWPWSQQLPG